MKKYWFWFFIICVFLVVIGMVWLQSQKIPAPYPNQPPKEPPLPTATTQSVWPTMTKTEIIPATTVPEPVKQQILPLLPYELSGFLVEYLPKADKFYVTIYPPDYQANYQQAVNWLRAQQIPNPKNNSQVRFVYLKNN